LLFVRDFGPDGMTYGVMAYEYGARAPPYDGGVMNAGSPRSFGSHLRKLREQNQDLSRAFD